MVKIRETEQTKAIREKYKAYKVGDLAVKLFISGVSESDVAYIMKGGEAIKMQPYAKLQAWLAGAMDRMAERIDKERAEEIRQNSACCLVGTRQQIARSIYKNNPTVEARFEALSKERRIIGGNAWKEGNDYFISFWYAKPSTGYTCGCLRHVPTQPMNKLWCECCSGHIKHHFEIALGVRATCHCVTSVLSSAGEDACLFKLNIVEEAKDDDSSDVKANLDMPMKLLFDDVCEVLRKAAQGKAELQSYAKQPTFVVGDSFVRVIPFKDHVNIQANAVANHREELADYKITPKGFLQIFVGQEIPRAVLEAIASETFKGE